LHPLFRLVNITIRGTAKQTATKVWSDLKAKRDGREIKKQRAEKRRGGKRGREKKRKQETRGTFFRPHVKAAPFNFERPFPLSIFPLFVARAQNASLPLGLCSIALASGSWLYSVELLDLLLYLDSASVITRHTPHTLLLLPSSAVAVF